MRNEPIKYTVTVSADDIADSLASIIKSSSYKLSNDELDSYVDAFYLSEKVVVDRSEVQMKLKQLLK